jgi:hypothetical protein
VTGPGTAITGRPSSRASLAVASVPLCRQASTTTVPCASAAMSLLLAANEGRAGAWPGGHSLIRTRWAATAASSSS